MKKLLLLLLCVPLVGLGQSWEQIYLPHIDSTAEYGVRCVQTTDGGYILLCGVEDTVDKTRLIKTNSQGDTLWTKIIGYESSVGDGGGIIQTIDGGYLIASSSDYNTNQVLLTKADGLGNLIWTKTHLNHLSYKRVVTDLIYTFDGGLIVAGGIVNSSSSSKKAFLLKTDINGDSIWVKIYDHNIIGEMGCNNIIQTIDSGYVFTHSNGITKTNEFGDTIWTKLYNNYLVLKSVVQTIDSGFVFLGYNASLSNNVSLVKTDSFGNIVWFKDYNTLNNSPNIPNIVSSTSDNGYIFSVNSTGSLIDPVSLTVIKTNSIGDTLWTTVCDSIFWGNSILETNDGGYILITNSLKSNYDGSEVCLIKLDKNGYISNTFFLENKNDRKVLKTIDFLGKKINPEKNKPFIEIYDDGTVEKKIIIE